MLTPRIRSQTTLFFSKQWGWESHQLRHWEWEWGCVIQWQPDSIELLREGHWHSHAQTARHKRLLLSILILHGPLFFPNPRNWSQTPLTNLTQYCWANGNKVRRIIKWVQWGFRVMSMWWMVSAFVLTMQIFSIDCSLVLKGTSSIFTFRWFGLLVRSA